MFRILYTEPWDFTNYLEEFIELILQETCYDVKYVKNIFMQIAFTITCSMQERNTGDCSLKSMETILEDMHKIDSMQSIISYIRTYTAQTIGRIQKENSQMSCQGRKVLDFINTHYMEKYYFIMMWQKMPVFQRAIFVEFKEGNRRILVNI